MRSMRLCVLLRSGPSPWLWRSRSALSTKVLRYSSSKMGRPDGTTRIVGLLPKH
jgi:hypothetical protein